MPTSNTNKVSKYSYNKKTYLIEQSITGPRHSHIIEKLKVTLQFSLAKVTFNKTLV